VALANLLRAPGVVRMRVALVGMLLLLYRVSPLMPTGRVNEPLRDFKLNLKKVQRKEGIHF
jgi:hypothetical protein